MVTNRTPAFDEPSAEQARLPKPVQPVSLANRPRLLAQIKRIPRPLAGHQA